MTQITTKPSKISLYDRDLNLWLETAIAQLKAGDFHNLDVENLIEELEGLAGRDRRELKNRLATLLEHLLKRCYVSSEYDYAGWENTIYRTRFEILNILEQSPSLKNYIKQPEVFQSTFDFSLRMLRKNRDYNNSNFPNSWQFSDDIEDILNTDFWDIL
jgi:hypothetical protein